MTLPPGWGHVALGDWLPLSYGKGLTEAARRPGPYGVFGSSGLVGTHSAPLTNGPTLIVGRKGSVGRVYLSAGPCWPIDTAYFVEATKDRNIRFARYLLESLQLEKLDRSTAIPGLTRNDYSATIVPLAPLPEQERIVAEIEKQFTRLDAGVDALKRLQIHLKRYRASVLKAACEGRLVPTEAELARREGRGHQSADALLARGAEPGEPGRKRAGRLWGAGVIPELTMGERALLPEGWTWAKVGHLGRSQEDAVQVGPMSMKSSEFEESGIPVLNVGCVRWGAFDEGKADHLPATKAVKFDRYRIKPGDVLFTRSGTVGRCAVAQPRHAGWLMTFHLLRVRPDPEKCLSDYLRIALEGADHIRRQAREASIGTTRAGFNTNLLAGLDVPLPPLAEQTRIIAAAETQISILAQANEVVRASLRRSDRLRQSVLKRAFEGKLVPQSPKDEPANALLERIRATQTGGLAPKKPKRTPREHAAAESNQ